MIIHNNDTPSEEELRQKSEYEGAKTRAGHETGTSKCQIKQQTIAWGEKKNEKMSEKGGSKN